MFKWAVVLQFYKRASENVLSQREAAWEKPQLLLWHKQLLRVQSYTLSYSKTSWAQAEISGSSSGLNAVLTWTHYRNLDHNTTVGKVTNLTKSKSVAGLNVWFQLILFMSSTPAPHHYSSFYQCGEFCIYACVILLTVKHLTGCFRSTLTCTVDHGWCVQGPMLKKTPTGE